MINAVCMYFLLDNWLRSFEIRIMLKSEILQNPENISTTINASNTFYNERK